MWYFKKRMVRTAVFEIAANSFEIWLGRERPFKRRWGQEAELLVGTPQQWFSHLHISQNLVEGLLKHFWAHCWNIWFSRSEVGLENLHSRKFLGDTDAIHVRTHFENHCSTWKYFLILLIQNGQRMKYLIRSQGQLALAPQITALAAHLWDLVIHPCRNQALETLQDEYQFSLCL